MEIVRVIIMELLAIDVANRRKHIHMGASESIFRACLEHNGKIHLITIPHTSSTYNYPSVNRLTVHRKNRKFVKAFSDPERTPRSVFSLGYFKHIRLAHASRVSNDRPYQGASKI
ncbi:hypothetical protein XU18_4913 [Perkinsela sp. CCAP 1560/4]|nr:hypothetical protein XU18_4913 [Perkinsela sp. CCAP 1560/4]|eukprot:KNH03837.1 hypothetical protein XU18_4913 [Perkinsela sp. CCAP 1560/4]